MREGLRGLMRACVKGGGGETEVVLKTETLGGRGIRNRLVCGKWHERVPDVLAQRTLRKKKTHTNQKLRIVPKTAHQNCHSGNRLTKGLNSSSL